MESGFKSGNRSTRWQELSFAIVGLGLIGGSYAKALRKLGVKQIIGIERDAKTLAAAKAQSFPLICPNWAKKFLFIPHGRIPYLALVMLF